jgi:hypothetical protein
VLDEPPSALAKDDDRDFSTGQILLVAKVAVRRDEHIESPGFGGVEQARRSGEYPNHANGPPRRYDLGGP